MTNELYGLVLAGGGTRGSYQLGVWKALKELDVEIGAVTGTSIGALNGSFIALDAYDEAYDLWYNMRPSSVIKGNELVIEKISNRKIDIKSFNSIVKYMSNVLEEGGLNIDPLRELLKEKVNEEKLRNSEIDFGIVTVSLSDMKPVEVFIDEIPEGKLHDYLLASSNLPVFKSEKIDGKKYIDGAFHDNLPLKLMSSKGYKKIIAVDLGALGLKRNVKKDDLEITYITPSEPLGRTLEFNRETSRRNIEMGYYDTLKIFKNLAGKKYYITHLPKEDDVLNKLLSLPESLIMKLGKLFGIEGIPHRRMLFEKILPKVGEMLGSCYNDDYSTMILNLYEFVAEKLNIDRYAIYDYDTFEKLVTSKLKDYSTKDIALHRLPKILKQTNLYKWSLKDELLTHVLKEIS
ncbi:patatin-like phospholipase family protein [Oceanirhabdus sp. W0125-5]|uniref:patatin-like phospholipase family protein n=1 Tax=Oceanirhabdus sp. W0125-5 TaxID=2999116 RepID=UPI0022F2E77F|nr:patatin-like phospholipase family protein [Oceanirhabdus sp. W0125-5]WBW99021.1 patatin-like phospholipase family protein [Oceanirhabdus sp. W0125-5]